MKFGDRIKQRRIELHMSAGELGSLIGKNRATVYRYESGDIENIPLEMLDKLAEALSVTPEYLMGWSDSKLLGTRIKNGEKGLLYRGVNDSIIRHLEHWHANFQGEPFSEEEYLKLVEYAKFLIYLREK